MVLGVASFAGMDAIGKWAVRDFSVFQVLAVRSAVAAGILLLLAPYFGGREVLRTSQPAAHVLRSLCSTVAFLFFFASVRILPLADAIAVEFGGPFMVVALSVPLLGERVGRRRWIAVAVGFLGMLLVAQPTGRGFRPEALLVLLASVSYSLMMVLTRWMAERSGGKERTFTFLAYTFAVQGLVGLLGAPAAWESMSGFDVALTAAMESSRCAAISASPPRFRGLPLRWWRLSSTPRSFGPRSSGSCSSAISPGRWSGWESR